MTRTAAIFAAFAIVSGCAARKPAQPKMQGLPPRLTIPRDCIDSVFEMKPGAQCSSVKNGHLRCRDFEVEFHCYKVKGS